MKQHFSNIGLEEERRLLHFGVESMGDTESAESASEGAPEGVESPEDVNNERSEAQADT